MAGYSGKPLWEKLGIRPGSRVAILNGPSNVLELLSPLPIGAEILDANDAEIDVLLLFATSASDYAALFELSRGRIKRSGMIWSAWPKKSAKAQTDLTETLVREIGLELGLVDVKVCAIDDYWSGLKFVYRLKDRTK